MAGRAEAEAFIRPEGQAVPPRTSVGLSRVWIMAGKDRSPGPSEMPVLHSPTLSVVLAPQVWVHEAFLSPGLESRPIWLRFSLPVPEALSGNSVVSRSFF